MKKQILISLFTAITTLLIILIVLEIKAQKEQFRADTVEEINSKILNESRKLLVHLPKDYKSNKNKNYPILFALDGTSHDQDISNAASILNYANVFPEIIIIGIPNTNRNRDLTPNYMMKDNKPNELGSGDKFLLFLEKEAIPLIENKYRTSGYRMISGNSRGGLFTMYALIEKPNIFHAYFSYSPAFWRNNNLISDKMTAFLKHKTHLNKFIYMSLGSNENEKMKRGFKSIITVLDSNKTSDLKFYYKYTSKATHGTNAYYSIPLALKTWSDQY